MALRQETVLPEIKSADDKKKTELLVENFAKSFAFVFGYYVNDF